MSCNTGIFNLDKCLKSIGGIKNMWVSPKLPLTYLKTEHNYETIYFLGAAHEYSKLNIKDDSVSLTTEISVNDEVGNTSYTTNISIKQADLLANDLKQYADAELSVIFQDIQDRYYIVGYDNLCKLSTGSATSGAQLGDFNGVEITLTTSDRPVLLVSSLQQAEELGVSYYVMFSDDGISPSITTELSADNIILPQINGVTSNIETIDNKLVVTCEYDEEKYDSLVCFGDSGFNYRSDVYLDLGIDADNTQIQQILQYFEEKGEEEVYIRTVSGKLPLYPTMSEDIYETFYDKRFSIHDDGDRLYFGIELSDYIPKEYVHNAILDVTVNSGMNISNSKRVMKFTINNLYIRMY